MNFNFIWIVYHALLMHAGKNSKAEVYNKTLAKKKFSQSAQESDIFSFLKFVSYDY